MATATKIKGFQVLCPHCHDGDATVTLDLNDLGECRCSACDETFSPLIAREMFQAEVDRWAAVCRWIEIAKDLL